MAFKELTDRMSLSQDWHWRRSLFSLTFAILAPFTAKFFFTLFAMSFGLFVTAQVKGLLAEVTV